MSGYESIRDWALEEYPIENYDTFQNWLDDIENDFNPNGRGIDLNKIFDNQDYIDLENEFNERKGIEIDEDERLREEEEQEEILREEREIEKEEKRIEKEEKEKKRIEKEEKEKKRIEREEREIEREPEKERVQTFREIGSEIVGVGKSVVRSVKRLFGR